MTAKSNKHLHPACTAPTDVFHLPTIGTSVELEFTHCRPSKSSANSLGSSGSTLGLAPSQHLSQTGSTSILKQLFDMRTIERPVFSLMLINDHEGVLSVGGTAANAVDLVVTETEQRLDLLGAMERGETSVAERPTGLARRDENAQEAISVKASWENGWAWSKVQGAEGWW